MIDPRALRMLMHEGGLRIIITPCDHSSDANFQAVMDAGTSIQRVFADTPAKALETLLASCPYPARDLATFIADMGLLDAADAAIEAEWLPLDEEDADE